VRHPDAVDVRHRVEAISQALTASIATMSSLASM